MAGTPWQDEITRLQADTNATPEQWANLSQRIANEGTTQADHWTACACSMKAQELADRQNKS